MKRFIPLFLPLLCSAQCDLELLDFDPIAGEITVAFNNTESCGGSAGPTGIAEIQFGFQALDENCNAINQGWEFPWGLTTSSDNNHPGWIFSATTTTSATNWTNLDVWSDYNVEPPYYTGDTITFPLGDFYQSGGTSLYANLLNAFDFWLDQGLGIQAVIWQISYGPTMYADNGGWAEVGGLGGGITPPCCGLYEDSNWQDNWIIMCPEDVPEVIYVYDTVYVNLPADTIVEYVYDTTYVELPPDTIVETLTDTLYVTETDTVVINDTIPVPINWYFYDTTYVYITDTLYITEYDTVYQQLPPEVIEYYFTDTLYVTEYVFDTTEVYITDTVQEYIVQEIWLDCNTGLPCDDQPGMDECDEMVVFVPNVFTPNNDGVNDAFYAKQSNPGCWMDWGMSIYNRWGDRVYYSEDPEEKWNGGVNGGDHYVADGVYAWVIKAKSYGGRSLSIQGSVQVLR